MMYQNVPNRVLRSRLQNAWGRPYEVLLSEEATYYSQKIFFSLSSQYCTSYCLSAGPAAADDHGPQFPNQNLKCAIGFGALTNLGGVMVGLVLRLNVPLNT